MSLLNNAMDNLLQLRMKLCMPESEMKYNLMALPLVLRLTLGRINIKSNGMNLKQCK
jgi:hypothetical protein